MNYLADTNVFAALALPKPIRAVELAFTRYVATIVTSSVVTHELWFGIERMPASARRTHLERFMIEIVGSLRVLPYDERAARWHASERARLAALGTVVDFADGQVAAVAAMNDATLVTANVRHFAGFEGVRVVSWGAR